jgi:hypothetical protein
MLEQFSPRWLAALLAITAIVGSASALIAVFSPASAGARQTAAVQTHLLWSQYDSAEVDRQLDKAKAVGAGMVRVDAGWGGIEPHTKGSYSEWYLSRMDAVVDKAQARGLKVLFTFWETPCWASSAPADLKQDCAGEWWKRGVQRYPPVRSSDYADALEFVVKRYRDRVAAWEIWNEPNLSYFFKATDKAATYADLVKAAYPSAKAAHPESTIIAGSLSGADVSFTRALYSEGIEGSFDAFSVHPYSGDRSPLDPGDDRWIHSSFVRGVPAVRSTMLQEGDDKPLWLTEFGWSTCDIRDQEPYRNCVAASVQADYLRLAYGQMQSWRYVEVGVWYNLQNTSANLSDLNGNYGLLNYEEAEKPAYAAFRAASAVLNRTTSVVRPVADAHVRSDYPSVNYGDSPGLRVDGGPVSIAYLRFHVDVPSDRRMVKAKLRIHTRVGSSSGFTVHDVFDDAWAEGRVTYETAPAIGRQAAASGPFSSDSEVDIDVTPLVRESGPVSMTLKRTSTSSNIYPSREAMENRPKLVVTTDLTE